MSDTTPPDQPEDAALKQKIISLDKGTQKGIVTVQVGLNDLMQLFREHECQAVRKANISQIENWRDWIADTKGAQTWQELVADMNEAIATLKDETLTDENGVYLEAIQSAQPPAADATKQGEGDEYEQN